MTTDDKKMREYALAFDTSNEVIAIGVGRLCRASKTIEVAGSCEVSAHRASNTQLLPSIQRLLDDLGLSQDDIACVMVGRGPGSFTGVRIAMATAKGIAESLEVPLVGLSTLEIVAYGAWLAGIRGRLLVAADAMRKEIYPAYFLLLDAEVRRLTADRVVKAADFAAESGSAPCALSGALDAAGLHGTAGTADNALKVTGDALAKYSELLSPLGTLLATDLHTPTGAAALALAQAMWREGAIDPFSRVRHDPMALLPIYTRLSDAEENERARLGNAAERDLETGVQGSPGTGEGDVECRPFDAAYAPQAAQLEQMAMGTDAWSAAQIEDELPRKDRSWWMAVRDGELVGYAGIMLAGSDAELLKIAVRADHRRCGVASELLARVAEDARNLAAGRMLLEVRASNDAVNFYQAKGFKQAGARPKYYSDGEDALLLEAPIDALLGSAQRSSHNGERGPVHGLVRPLILAIETSCDETAASIVDGNGDILSDIVSSQIDFHARFGGVVPEIASRKHIEAIAGVCRLALSDAAAALGREHLDYSDLDAVGVTYAPGLVGALVVGVAFAKGAAWAQNLPIVGVNHLEGHLYANKFAQTDDLPFQPPTVVSLVSGGNTMLVHMEDWQKYRILGGTIDDAVGEAFDKVAKALGLPYPGGPIISKYAEEGDPAAIDFPRALMHSKDYRFSLSGLKTAVMTYINEQREAGTPLNLPDICASFQQAVIDVQVHKAKAALKETGAKTFCLGGGVAANPALRQAYSEMCAKRHVELLMPPLSACGDNAAMIALVALDRYKQGKFFDLSADAYAHADLSVPY